MLTSRQIRQQFIDYFAKKCGHTFVPSSPVVPHEDPTLLFTNAGMNQFKDVFLGLGSRQYTRAVNTQKCIRAGGKHNDLDDVGKDTYHHTFFEMLGNWSFGDYFKKEAIDWAWDLLVNVWKMDPTRLHATYCQGSPEQGVEPDNEARNLWLQYLPPERIHPGSMKDNFWEMGDAGPCGPCSEIHVDLTADKSGANLVNKGTPKVIEIWNLVFMQFNRSPGTGGKPGPLNPLPARHVDTGMGFERLCAVLQGKLSNYDSDVFTPLFSEIQKITGAPAYVGKLDSNVDIAYRVLADHARCLTFAITDGAMPSNEGRGYVLRRILRRGVRYGRQHMNMAQPFLHRLVDVIVKTMGDVFPELTKDPKRVIAIIKEEEESFGRTLDRGIELFDQAAAIASNEFYVEPTSHDSQPDATDYLLAKGYITKGQPYYGVGKVNWRDYKGKTRPVIRGEDAFKLYDTYGFPLDLTVLMAEERGMLVDSAGFEKLMEQARQLSRAGAGASDDALASLQTIVQQKNPARTNFTGYDHMVADGAKAALVAQQTGSTYAVASKLNRGDSLALALDQTPFYAESGGQVGDVGVIHSRSGAVFKVEDTIKVGDIFFHMGKLETGAASTKAAPFGPEDQLLLEINQPRRRAIMAHHTSTHLLNWALREVLGDHVMQKGSLVDDQKTRFDFAHTKAMSDEEIARVQKLVNDRIADNLPVHIAFSPQADALKIKGLRAVFGEKYPPEVRVVCIGAPVKDLLKNPDKSDWMKYSIEFCGGTHLKNTADAGRFAILSEDAVAKGVRRVTAVAGEAARRAFAHAQVLSERIAALAKNKPESLEQDVLAINESLAAITLPLADRSALRGKLAELQSVVKEFKKQASKQAEGSVADAARKIAESVRGDLVITAVEGANAETIRVAMDIIRSKHPASAMMLAAVADGKIAFLAAVPEPMIKKGLKAGDWVREVAKAAGGGGGGRPDMAQAGGKDPAKLDEALQVARSFASGKLG